MQRTIAPKRTRKLQRTTGTRLSPYLLEEIGFTRSDIERARTDAEVAA